MNELIRIQNFTLSSRHDQLEFVLDVRYIPNSNPKPLVIFIHGFNGFKDWGHFSLIGDEFAKAGFVFLKLNLSHNGTTPTRPFDFVNLQAFGNEKFSIDLDDIGMVIDFVSDKQCPIRAEINADRIHLIGHSRGGALAILKAAEDDRVCKLATWASIASVHHFWTPENIDLVSKTGVIYYHNSRTQQKLPIYYACYEDILLNSERLNIEQKIQTLKIPILIVHGSADTSVNVEKAYALHGFQPHSELYIIEGANHTFGGQHPYLQEDLPIHSKILVAETIRFLQF
jgi:uncharacterized protein